MFNMKKFDVQEKSRGVLLFAFNTEINYVEIARRAACLVKHVLNLPVTLVTDKNVNSKEFDQVILVENTLQNYKVGTPGIWRNGDRFRAYELSPYYETILIDSDYLVLDQNLLKLFEQDFDYRMMTHNDLPDIEWPAVMGIYSLPYQWATVILFRKTVKSKMLFDMVKKIQQNYTYYLRLYHGKHGSFRNDYAFTIANNILNGYELGMDLGIPWPMLSFDGAVQSIDLRNNMLAIKEKEKAYLIPKQNIHVMDKEYLLTDNFFNFIESICQD